MLYDNDNDNDNDNALFIWSLIQSFVHRLYPNNLES